MKKEQLNKLQSRQNAARVAVMEKQNFASVKRSIVLDATNYAVTSVTLDLVISTSIKYYAPLFRCLPKQIRGYAKLTFAKVVNESGLNALHFVDNNGNIVCKRVFALIRSNSSELNTLLVNAYIELKQREQSFVAFDSDIME